MIHIASICYLEAYISLQQVLEAEDSSSGGRRLYVGDDACGVLPDDPGSCRHT